MMPLYINSEAGDVSRLLMSSDGFVMEGTGEFNGIIGSPDVLPVKECHDSSLGIVIVRLYIAWIRGSWIKHLLTVMRVPVR